jgi:hypothetical protein
MPRPRLLPQPLLPRRLLSRRLLPGPLLPRRRPPRPLLLRRHRPPQPPAAAPLAIGARRRIAGPAVARPAVWPIAALLLGFPVWWALGLGGLAVIPLSVPMAVVLWRRRPIRAPKGFGLWLLLIGAYLVSALTLGVTPPGTYGDLSLGRVIGYLMRLALYLAMLIMVLYLGNLTHEELPQLTLTRMLGALFVVSVAGGLLGVLAPGFSFTSPLERLLPHWLAGNSYVRNLIHPTLAQTQHVLGHASPRPEAPFEWANAWGGNMSVLAVWFAVAWWTYGRAPRRLAALAVGAVAAVPVVYSLNRGMWIGLAMAAAYFAVRGRQQVIMAVAVGAALLFAVSPLGAMVAQRLDSPQSNGIRAFTATTTVTTALHSPIIGYGNTRNALGNQRTITTGRSDWCVQCAHPPLGSDGQLWLLLISQGFCGAALYIAFFAGAVRRYWRDRSPIGRAGTFVMILALFYMFIYDGLVTALTLYLVSFAVLWRNHEAVPPR